MNLSFTLGEIITIGSLIVSVTATFTVLKGDVKALQDTVQDVKVDIKDIKESVEQLNYERNRMNAMMNFLYGESIREGWIMPKTYAEGVMKDLKELKVSPVPRQK